MTLQDTARVGGVLLWGVLKVRGLVGLFGADFGTVVTEALNAVITGSIHDLIRGSLMVSLGLFDLSLLAQASLTPPPDRAHRDSGTGTVNKSQGKCPGSQSSE